MGGGPQLTPEQARELGRRGGLKAQENRRARAAVKAEVRAKLVFEDRSEEMARLLVQAALGQGDFSKLDPKERAAFALKALEYGIGRPRPMAQEPVAPPEAPTGLVFQPPTPDAMDDDEPNEPTEEPSGDPEDA